MRIFVCLLLLMIFHNVPLTKTPIHKNFAFRILVVEHPFLRLVDWYQHIFANTAESQRDYMREVIKYWYEKLSDKLSKDKKSKTAMLSKVDGDLYFDVSDVEGDFVLTFKQFVHFLTKGTTLNPNSKVS